MGCVYIVGYYKQQMLHYDTQTFHKSKLYTNITCKIHVILLYYYIIIINYYYFQTFVILFSSSYYLV